MGEEEKPKTHNFMQMDVKPPTWMDKEFFEKVLKGLEHDENLKITNLLIKLATKPGDNFSSVVFRASIDYSTRNDSTISNRSFIIKVIPSIEGLQRDFILNSPIFKTEIDMYTKILPEMQRLLQQIGDDEILAPNLVYHSSDPPVVMLEDVADQNFQMYGPSFDYEGTKKIAIKLAKFHALSYFMEQENDPYVTEFSAGLYSEINLLPVSKIFMINAFDLFVNEVSSWDGFEIAVKKLNNLRGSFLDRIINIYSPNKSGKGYKVLNHGDFHTKNLLFQLNGNTIEKILFLDFQLCIWATPAIDLAYLLNIFASPETRAAHREELIFDYHTEFTSVLNKLGYMKKSPSLLDLNIELLQYGFMELLISVVILPIFLAIAQDSIPEEFLTEITEEKIFEMSKMLYKNPTYKEIIQRNLPVFLYKGYLD